MVTLDDRQAQHERATRYAAKFVAETMNAEPPRFPGASDAVLGAMFAGCARVPNASEYPAIRAAVARLWLAALVKVWCKDGRWYATVPLTEVIDARVPEAIERMRVRAAKTIGWVASEQCGEVVPWGPTIAGGPIGGEWHITPVKEPHAYLFADGPWPF